MVSCSVLAIDFFSGFRTAVSVLSPHLPKPLKLLRQPLPVGPVDFMTRQNDLLLMQRLQPMSQHGAVFFFPHVLPHDDFIIWGDAYHKPVKSGMVDLAQSQAVADNGLALRLFVFYNMSRIQRFGVFEAAEGALA